MTLNQATFNRYRSSTNRKVRKETFQAFFGTFKRYQNTLAVLLSAQINANITKAKVRKYPSSLAAALAPHHLPISIYTNMIKAVHKYLPLFHRYLKFRQRLLGLDQLHYFDLYTPIGPKLKRHYPFEQGQILICKALQPMGENYLKVLKKGLEPKSGWLDLYPNQGKRSGAYMNGSAYGVHPFVLSNYLDDFDSLTTLAHEYGHALHSYYSNQTQPFPKADYSIFLAEVASTLNEALLMAYLLENEKEPKTKLFLLGQKLADIRQTFFRQAMFAEFELALYQHAENGAPLTAEFITQLYLELLRRYHGHAKGVLQVEDLYGIEWAHVPHFYYNYYVFQYVTGVTAASALAQKIRHQGAAARISYITHLLKAGCSDFPMTLLKQAGVDLNSLEPYELTMKDFKETLAQAENVGRALAY